MLGRKSAATCCIAGGLLLLLLLFLQGLAAAGLGLVPPDSKGWDSHSSGDDADDPGSNLCAAPWPLQHSSKEHNTSSRQQSAVCMVFAYAQDVAVGGLLRGFSLDAVQRCCRLGFGGPALLTVALCAQPALSVCVCVCEGAE